MKTPGQATENHATADIGHDCLTCELKSPIFCQLKEKELELINKTKLTVVFQKGETIRKQGAFMSHVISVNAGLAKLYLENNRHHNTIVRLVKPTNFIGGPGIFLDRLHHFSVSALIETTVCFIDVDIFIKILDLNKAFAHEFMKDLSLTILTVYDRLVLLTQKHMPGRVADSLLYLADEIFLSHSFKSYLTKQDIADLSGMAKDSTMKTLRQFQKMGIISCDEHEIQILDYQALKRISKIG